MVGELGWLSWTLAFSLVVLIVTDERKALRSPVTSTISFINTRRVVYYLDSLSIMLFESCLSSMNCGGNVGRVGLKIPDLGEVIVDPLRE